MLYILSSLLLRKIVCRQDIARESNETRTRLEWFEGEIAEKTFVSMLRILIVVTCIKISTLASAQSKGTTSFDEDANSDEPDHPSEYTNILQNYRSTHKPVMSKCKISSLRDNQVIYCLTCVNALGVAQTNYLE